MIKTLPLLAAILFFTSCNQTSSPPKPDADRVIKDTFALNTPSPFNQDPPQKNIYVRVEAKQEKTLCARDMAIKKLMGDIKSPPQKFVVNNTQANEITGMQGTKLLFKPNCFVSNEGAEVSTPVTIELKECYTLEAMLHENLVTATEGGFAGSKGMLNVNAYAQGKLLKLKDGETMHVLFPFSTRQLTGCHFYFGNENADGMIAWNPLNEPSPDNKLAAQSGFSKPEFSYLGLDLKEYLHQSLSYPDEAKRNELSANVEVAFTVGADGEISDVTSAESYKIFRQVIEQSLTKMPAWKPATYNGKSIASSVHVNIDFNIRRSNQVQIAFNDNKASLVSNGSAVYLLYGTDLVRGKEQTLSAQSFSRTGWFNCRKTIKTGNQNAELIVCANEKSEVRLLMKKEAAIIGAENNIGFADFKNLPVGESAYIVAVRYDAGSMFYAVQPITLQKQTVVSLNWKKGNEQDLAKVYRQLSKDYVLS